MKIHLHKNAKTTPAQRSFIQKNMHLQTSSLARRLGVSESTIRKWRNRSSVFDKPHNPKTIRTALGTGNEIMTVLARICLQAGLDDLHMLMCTFFKTSCSRSALNRCLNRYHISRLPLLKRELPVSFPSHKGTCLVYTRILYTSKKEPFAPVCFHVVMDLHSRWLHIDSSFSCDPGQSVSFLNRLFSVFPVKVLALFLLGDFSFQGHFPDHTDQLLASLRVFCREKNLLLIRSEKNYEKTKIALKNAYLSLDPTQMVSWVESMDVCILEYRRWVTLYNRKIKQKGIKNQTPFISLNRRFKQFPSSFKYRWEQSCETSCG